MQARASPTRIVPVDASLSGAAVALLARFFSEEGFPGDEATIAARLEALLGEPANSAVIALDEAGEGVGVATVTTMLFVEWGRMAEIGDLYVVPSHRGQGVARALVQAATAWSRAKGCSAVSVVMTPRGRPRMVSPTSTPSSASSIPVERPRSSDSPIRRGDGGRAVQSQVAERPRCPSRSGEGPGPLMGP